MSESLYSNSPYVLVLSLIALALALYLPILFKRGIVTSRLASPLRSMVCVYIVWNFCSVLGILFVSGNIDLGSRAYIFRQVLFGVQALCWFRIGFLVYNTCEIALFGKRHMFHVMLPAIGDAFVIVLTVFFVLFPESIANFQFFEMQPFKNAPIFYSFLIIYIIFDLPVSIAIVYQLLRAATRSIDTVFLRTGAYMVGCFIVIISIACAFDFVVPIITNFTFISGGFHFMIWHQFLCLLLAIICCLYYTSALFKEKGSFWFLQKLISKLEEGIIFFNDDAKIIFANRGASLLLGQMSTSLQGKSIKSLFPPNLDFFRESVYSDIHMNIGCESHVLKIHFLKFRQTLTTSYNVAFFCDQSKTLLLQQNLKTLNEQYVEYTHDLVRYQDRLNREASIKAEKENVLNTLINALPFRVWYKSEFGVYQKQNQKDLEMRGSLEGVSDDAQNITQFEKDARELGEVKAYSSYEDKNGNEISHDEANRKAKNGELVQSFDNMFIPIIQGTPPYKTLCLKIDMTEQRRLEQERNMLREQKFIHSRLEELGTMCGAFAHDYNNILGSQIGFCQLAQEMLSPDNQAYMFVGEALKAAERGKASLEELLNSIRGNASAATPAIVFSPYMIIDDVVKKISLTLPKNIAIHSDDMDKSIKICGVVASLDRIISNLANNAIFSMKKLGGTLTFRLVRETLKAQLVTPYAPPVPAGNYAKMQISDTGSGMDSNTLERIFAPFFTTKAPGEGLGLGLSSALRLLKEGKAYFTVQTTLGEGTTFYLYWPLETEPKEG